MKGHACQCGIDVLLNYGEGTIIMTLLQSFIGIFETEALALALQCVVFIHSNLDCTFCCIDILWKVQFFYNKGCDNCIGLGTP